MYICESQVILVQMVSYFFSIFFIYELKSYIDIHTLKNDFSNAAHRTMRV